MTTATQIPGYIAGTWDIDPVHSDVSFTVRHMMVSKVRGHFATFGGTIVTGSDIAGSEVNATIDATSIETGTEQRDNHIRSADFFEVEKHPTWTFASTAIRPDGDDFAVEGNLTIKGVTPRSRSASRSTASGRTPSAAPAPASRPTPPSTAATSASTSRCRSTAAAWSSARRCRSTSRSRQCCAPSDVGSSLIAPPSSPRPGRSHSARADGCHRARSTPPYS